MFHNRPGILSLKEQLQFLQRALSSFVSKNQGRITYPNHPRPAKIKQIVLLEFGWFSTVTAGFAVGLWMVEYQ